MRAIAAVLLAVALAGCAGYRPIVDMKGVESAKYEADLKECQAYAEQVDVGGSGLGGAAIGAGLGAVLGAIICSPLGSRAAGQCAGIGAGAGGVSGAAQGTAYGAGGQMQVIKNCMAGRGYKVLR